MPLSASASRRLLEQSLHETFGSKPLSYEQFVAVTGCRSALLAKRLFEAIDTDKSGDISLEELLEAVYVLQSRDSDRRTRFIFDLFDLDHNGVITESELRTALYASLEEGDLNTSKAERDDLVSSLVDLFEMRQDGRLTFEEFAQTLSVYPDMLEGFSLEGVSVCRTKSDAPVVRSRWRKFQLWVVNHPQGLLTYTLLTVTLVGCFFWRFQRYMWSCDGDDDDSLQCLDARKRALLGWSLPIAKGAGQAMKATFTLILLPVSRNLMTNLRSTFLKYFFNFDASIDFHKVLGTIGFALAWVHTACHIVDLKRWADPDRRQLYFEAFPRHERQPGIGDLLQEQVVITGLILITVYTVAATFALDYPRKLRIFNPKRRLADPSLVGSALRWLGQGLNNFNNFWYTHHLFVIFYVCLTLHPKPAIPHERYEWAVSDSWVWILVPVFIYVLERLTRFVLSDSRDTSVLSADLLPGNVVELKVMKPRGLVYVAGQYVFLNCPQLSRFEWHPFTLTSSPGDSYLAVHVRAAGDWTQALYDAVRRHSRSTEELEVAGVDVLAEKLSTGLARRRTASVTIKSVSGLNAEVIPGTFPFDIKVDGPFGAPSQNYKDYKVANIIVLIGAGIGVTPFASVLSDLLDVMQHHKCAKCGAVNLPASFKVQKVYFYWTVRSRKEAAWFKHVLEAINQEDEDGFIDINIHITSFRRANDVRVMLLRLAQYHGKERGIDPLSSLRTRTVTNLGRPNWQCVFEKVKKAHQDQTHHCGVFYCGPNSLAQVLREETRRYSSREMKFELNTESFG